MNKYNEIEVKTAQNLLKEGYKWIVRDTSSYGHNIIFAHKEKPHRIVKIWTATTACTTVCYGEVPIFQNISSDDKEPVSLESIVHPQILDDVEHRYLAAVIKPFRNDVHSIEKVEQFQCEMICIDTKNRYMVFPPFDKGTMYKGMKTNREYTPDELCL